MERRVPPPPIASPTLPHCRAPHGQLTEPPAGESHSSTHIPTWCSVSMAATAGTDVVKALVMEMLCGHTERMRAAQDRLFAMGPAPGASPRGSVW